METLTYESLCQTMAQAYEQYTGHSPDDASDIGVRIQILASRLESLWQELSLIEAQAFPGTSSGSYLDQHASARGLARKAALPARGHLLFGRDSRADVDLLIPAGTLCACPGDDLIRVRTTEDVTLAAGEVEVLCPGEAVAGGKQANYAPGAVSVMVTPVPGITHVHNPQPFAGGVDEESDTQLRGRLESSYRELSNGANKAFYLGAALGFEGVASANVLPLNRGVGTVDVAVAGESGPLPDGLTDEIQGYLESIREIGVDVQVVEATPKLCNLSIEAAPCSGGDFAAVQAAVTEAASLHFARLGVGKPLLLSRLTGEIMARDGVYNCRMLPPAEDIQALPHEILRLGTVDVQRMAVTG